MSLSRIIIDSTFPSMITLQLLHCDRSPFLGGFTRRPFFQSSGTASVSQIFTSSGCYMSVDVWTSALRASSGMPSSPAVLPDLRDLMAFMVSCFVGGLVLTFSSCVAGGLSGGSWWWWSIQNLLEMFGPSYSLLIFPSDGLSALVSDRASGVACFSRQHSCDLIESLHISLLPS